ncbi:hypothetical protein [Clostridium sp. BNL1100]|uniref:hypothetical protein n=1 Tax=Clostridium sp. BNL1100 TaxID=755731 RepID=UPI00024A7A8F|nr:hypothetical protein [Clostridium sp. BNL1100]AEY66599.1 hypothetical protein Clo1100_2428 [Clostridium sp. BNL1100]
MWREKFQYLISIGKTKEYLITKVNSLYSQYPEQFETGEYELIIQDINEAYPA